MTQADQEQKTRLSIREAARAAGVSERTMRRYVAAGRVSLSSDAQGARWVDPEELLRAGLLRRSPMTPAANAAPVAAAEADTLRERVAALEARVREVEADRDAWRGQAEGLLRMLPAPAAPEPAPARRSWWSRVIGR